MISTKKIKEIKSNTLFFIPDYQRGYKWKNLQVEQLLNDIIEFEHTSKGNLNQSYCLQPIVLKKMNKNDERLEKVDAIIINDAESIYELIDGQQRLTTIFLLLTFLNNRFKEGYGTERFSIFYETRLKSYEFLQSMTEFENNDLIHEIAKKNIDFHHILQAYEQIINFFNPNQGQEVDVNLFESTLLFRTQFIWYEIDKNEPSLARNIFNRLNSGKIELNNAELVKALFLGKYFGTSLSNDERNQMAIEWESMETKLNNDEFWYFLSNEIREKDNRIDFLLNQFASKQNLETYNPNDPRYTFLVFNVLLTDKEKVNKWWKKLKIDFRVIHNWFEERELFHYIGFLLSAYVDMNIKEIFEIFEDSENSIDNFKNLLRVKIDEIVNVKITDLDHRHDLHQIRRVLLWSNIAYILRSKDDNYRFNFFQFKDLTFDVEHIKSIDSDITKSSKSQNKFLTEFFDYYNDIPFKESKNDLDINKGEHSEILKSVFEYLIPSEIEGSFLNILNQIKKHFEIIDFEPKEEHSLGNLCLLDQATNRSYKNAIFPMKRSTIVLNDMNGIYVLPMTKNVFLKQFSEKTKNILVWTQDDISSYTSNIEKLIE